MLAWPGPTRRGRATKSVWVVGHEPCSIDHQPPQVGCAVGVQINALSARESSGTVCSRTANPAAQFAVTQQHRCVTVGVGGGPTAAVLADLRAHDSRGGLCRTHTSSGGKCGGSQHRTPGHTARPLEGAQRCKSMRYWPENPAAALLVRGSPWLTRVLPVPESTGLAKGSHGSWLAHVWPVPESTGLTKASRGSWLTHVLPVPESTGVAKGSHGSWLPDVLPVPESTGRVKASVVRGSPFFCQFPRALALGRVPKTDSQSLKLTQLDVSRPMSNAPVGVGAVLCRSSRQASNIYIYIHIIYIYILFIHLF